MSFSSDLKMELSRINNLAKKEEVKYELIGYLISKNTSIVKKNIRFATESEYNINRFSKLLKNLNINHKIEFDGKSFIIFFNVKDSIDEIEVIDNEILIAESKIDNENLNRAIIRGAFLGAGSINNPEKKYHFQINLSNKTNLDFLFKKIKDCKINCKRLEDKYSLYIKEGEEIASIIALMGGSKSMLQFEDIRVMREMRGKVNRIVNCQTANLNKTINASVEQIDAIRKLQQKNLFNKLEDNLKEIALLRLEFPDASLVELGKKLKQPVGKSGVNYRLKKIIEIANDIK